jgi:hypothetical protein
MTLSSSTLKDQALVNYKNKRDQATPAQLEELDKKVGKAVLEAIESKAERHKEKRLKTGKVKMNKKKEKEY